MDGMNYDAIPTAIRDTEIVLLPSLFESFSYTCIESMAAGKAIVGSNNGGMSDLLQNGESGLLIDPENYQDIYAAIKRLVQNNELRYSIAVKTRERVLKDFNATAPAEKLIAYYQHLIDAAK